MILTLKVRPLIVTQQLIIGADLSVQLSRLDLDVIGIVTSSSDAINNIESLQPDVVLLDLSLKGSIDGLSLGQIIKTKYNIPFIFLNPGLDFSTCKKALDLHPSGLISIPYQIETLKQKIQEASRMFCES